MHAAGLQCGDALAQLRKQRLTHDHIETLGTQLVDLHGELDTLQRALTSAHADPLSVVPAPILAAALAAELPPRCVLTGCPCDCLHGYGVEHAAWALRCIAFTVSAL